jgi:hypothetical protein
MLVQIGEKVWAMEKERYNSVLKVASDAVPFGIYAVEKNGKAEMRRDMCSSIGELKKLTRAFKEKGYKVHSNKGGKHG